MGNNNKFLAGLIAGAVVGAVTALLLAPKSGKETRQLLKEKAGVVGEKAKDLKDIVARRISSGGEGERAGNGVSVGREG
jgi:gas vesicle protein